MVCHESYPDNATVWNDYTLVKFVPFNPVDKFTMAIIRENATDKIFRVMKGAPQVCHTPPCLLVPCLRVFPRPLALSSLPALFLVPLPVCVCIRVCVRVCACPPGVPVCVCTCLPGGCPCLPVGCPCLPASCWTPRIHLLMQEWREVHAFCFIISFPISLPFWARVAGGSEEGSGQGASRDERQRQDHRVRVTWVPLPGGRPG